MSTFPANKALELLRGESQGFAIDATTEGGSIAVKDTTTRANNHLISGVTTDFRNGLDSANEVRGGAVKLINSGTSPKTVLKADGTLGWSPHNYLAESSQQDAWAFPTEITVTAGKPDPFGGTKAVLIVPTTNSSTHRNTQTSGESPAGFNCVFSAYVKANGYTRTGMREDGIGGAYAAFDLSDGSVIYQGDGASDAAITSVGGGWYLISFVMAAESGANYGNYVLSPSYAGGTNIAAGSWVGNGTDGIYVFGPQVNRGDVPTLYLPTTSAARIGVPQGYDVGEEQYGIRVEPAATNLTTYSQQLDQWQVGWGATTTADSTTAPDSTTTGDTLTASSGGTHHAVYSPATMGGGASSDVTCTYSWYLKQGTARYAVLSSTQDGTNWYAAIFDLQDGAVTQTGDGASGTYQSSSISSVGNGWYRCSVTGNHSGGNSYPFVGISNAATPSFANYGLVSFSAAGTETIYTWGMQYENGTIATSYIPTLGSTVTRAADDVNATATGFPLSTTAHTLIDKLQTPNQLSGTPQLSGIINGDQSEAIVLRLTNSAGNLSASDGGAGQVNMNTVGVVTQNANFIIGMAYVANDVALSLNGEAAVLDQAATVPTPDRLSLPASNTLLHSHVIYLPRRVTNGELQWMTAGDTHLLASLLLDGENNGLACDFTESTGVGAVSVKDQNTPANILYNTAADNFWINDGTSPKIVRTSSGTVKWAPHNYCVQSQTFQTTWAPTTVTVTANDTNAPDGTATADKLDPTSSNSWITSAAITVINGAQYTVSVWLKAGGAVSVGLYSLSGSNTVTTCNVTTSWQRFEHVVTADSTSLYVQIGGATSFATGETIWAWGAQLNRGGTALTYLPTTSAARIGCAIDYDGTEYGLLIERAATNLAVRSEQLDNASWTAQNVTISADAVTAPDGTSTADTMTASGSVTTHSSYVQTTYATSNSVVTLSAYAKKGTCNYITIAGGVSSGNYIGAAFDVNTGVVGETSVGGTSGTVVGTTITAIGNGWYRCTLTGSVTDSVPFNVLNFSVGHALTGTGNTWGAFGSVTDAAASLTTHFWGMQAELGSVATSYIPTLSSTVTRASDGVLTTSIGTLPYSATAESFYFKYKWLGGTKMIGLSIENSSGSDFIQEYSNPPHLHCYPDMDINAGGSALVAGDTVQLSGAFQANNSAASRDGAAVVTDSTGDMPDPATRIAFEDWLNTQVQNQHVKKFVYVPRRVTDADLPTWRYEV